MNHRAFHRIIQITATACLLSFVRPVPVSAETGALPNFHTVEPGIYRGAAPTSEGLEKLRSMGVRTIIDLRIAPKTVAREKEEAQRLGFQFINLPMGSDPPTEKQVSALLAALQRAPQEPVFVHCQHGADRTGCMMGIWRVSHDHWTFARTYVEMRQYGFKPYLGKLAESVRKRAGK